MTGDQTSKWCTDHSLPESVAVVLRERGFHSTDFLESLRPEVVPSLGLHNIAQECLLRQALEKKWAQQNSSTGESVVCPYSIGGS